MQSLKVLGCAVSLLAATTATAQIYRGHDGSPSDRELKAVASPEANAREQMQKFARCLLVRSPKRTEAYLALPPGSAEADNEARSLSISFNDCLRSGTMKFNPTLLRGAMYEALYIRDFPMEGPTRFASATPGAPAVQPGTGPASPEVAALMQVGECIARAERPGSRALVLSKPGTADEDVAIKTVVPALSSCLPAGQTVRFSPSVLRGSIAEMLYRLSLAEAS